MPATTTDDRNTQQPMILPVMMALFPLATIRHSVGGVRRKHLLISRCCAAKPIVGDAFGGGRRLADRNIPNLNGDPEGSTGASSLGLGRG